MPANPVTQTAPIGVFDSGIGGLTVAAAIHKQLPGHDIFYIGDTARVPYGGKSKPTVERYSREISALLLSGNSRMIVAACNTASALAVPSLQGSLPVPVIGVILPGAAAAAAATRNGKIGVIATKATIRSHAYREAIVAINPELEVTSLACPMLVPLIEEGWVEDPITNDVLHRYIDPLLSIGIDTLVLGCTHYPLLKSAIQGILGDGVKIVDSAENCALAVASQLGEGSDVTRVGSLRIALTDTPGGFLNTAARALELELGKVEHIATTV